ncbi:hypothetical protein LPJ66_003206, partial [Kickxella alabastrina]
GCVRKQYQRRRDKDKDKDEDKDKDKDNAKVSTAKSGQGTHARRLDIKRFEAKPNKKSKATIIEGRSDTTTGIPCIVSTCNCIR